MEIKTSSFTIHDVNTDICVTFVCTKQTSNQLLMYRNRLALKQTITANNLIVLIECKTTCTLEQEYGILEW